MKGLSKLLLVCLFISSAQLFAMQPPAEKPGCCEPKGCCCLCWTGFCRCCSKTIDIVAMYGPTIAALAGTVVSTIPGLQEKDKAMAAAWINAIQVIGTNQQTQGLLKALSKACSETATELSTVEAATLSEAGVPVKDGKIDPRFKLLFQNMVAQAQAEVGPSAPTRSISEEPTLVVLPPHVVEGNLHRRLAHSL